MIICHRFAAQMRDLNKVMKKWLQMLMAKKTTDQSKTQGVLYDLHVAVLAAYLDHPVLFRCYFWDLPIFNTYFYL